MGRRGHSFLNKLCLKRKNRGDQTVTIENSAAIKIEWSSFRPPQSRSMIDDSLACFEDNTPPLLNSVCLMPVFYSEQNINNNYVLYLFCL
jgi:hypothetical protein